MVEFYDFATLRNQIKIVCKIRMKIFVMDFTPYLLTQSFYLTVHDVDALCLW